MKPGDLVWCEYLGRYGMLIEERRNEWWSIFGVDNKLWTMPVDFFIKVGE